MVGSKVPPSWSIAYLFVKWNRISSINSIVSNSCLALIRLEDSKITSLNSGSLMKDSIWLAMMCATRSSRRCTLNSHAARRMSYTEMLTVEKSSIDDRLMAAMVFSRSKNSESAMTSVSMALSGGIDASSKYKYWSRISVVSCETSKVSDDGRDMTGINSGSMYSFSRSTTPSCSRSSKIAVSWNPETNNVR
ncbi:hypothetical protein OGAPHI_001104 [Ogataea philodendri]|uniref:Uncharacterized protein n=1 Tax=Ogataea philodendri TaxID=1378263 RepID=A0A9P8PG27_9ASCO|nr:uncharacterized protein OGAPHI_001104 [Ogataea philodendri]KAH3670589.1 hypothetical protein OGAPHI_001104 [Ogataea philodendri]